MEVDGISRKGVPLAKQELQSHLVGVQMHPSEDEEGCFYIAEGTWDLLGDALAPKSWVLEVLRFELVAEAGFEHLNHRPLGYEARGKLQLQILCDADDNP